MNSVSFGGTIKFHNGAISPGSMLPRGAKFQYDHSIGCTVITGVPDSELAATARKLQDFYGFGHAITTHSGDDYFATKRFLEGK